MQINWQSTHHSQLTPQQLYKILQIRSEVFTAGQQLVYQDLDELDLIDNNHHIMGWQQDHLIAYARILTSDPDHLKIGRVCVTPSARGLGIGMQLVKNTLATCKQIKSDATIKISAQIQTQEFYTRLGFIAEGDIFYEAGIPHIKMLITHS